MIRVLTILAAVVALSVTAAPASVASRESAPHYWSSPHYWSADDETYLHMEMENVLISN
jgi:hypothetical protein